MEAGHTLRPFLVQMIHPRFGISVEEARRILSEGLSRGGSYADLYFEERRSSSVVLEDSIIKSAGRGITTGAGVRVLKGDQSGYAFSEDLTVESLIRAARTAAAIADANSSIQIAPAFEGSKRNLYPASAESTLEEKIKLLRDADNAARAFDPSIEKVSASISDEIQTISCITSEGKVFGDVRPMVILRVSCIAQKSGKRQTGSDSAGGRFGLEYFSERRTAADIAKEAARLAVLNLNAEDAPAGPMEVVLGPAESGVLLHEAVGHGLEADFNRKNLSNYSNRIGERVASEHCTIVDEGLFSNMRGSINVDDEGNEPSSAVLIENGILRGYINDRMSAEILKTAPTGNGRRESYRCLPMPRMTNTYMRPGAHDPGEILSTVKRGIYAKRFGGGQVDITKGDFVFSVLESYLIEDGKITRPLKGVTLIGNGPDVMTKVVMVGNDLTFTEGGWTCGKDGQSVPVGMGIPTCKVSEITVGGSRV